MQIGMSKDMNTHLNRIDHGKKKTAAGKEFLYKELSSAIIDSAYKVHNALGCGLLEKAYENSLVWELFSQDGNGLLRK